MYCSGPLDKSTCEDPCHVTLPGLLDAVGRHKDRTGEFVEFLLLILPCSAVVANEMGVFLKFRISIAGKHLTVRIDVDTLALCLLQQLFKIAKVVS